MAADHEYTKSRYYVKHVNNIENININISVENGMSMNINEENII